MRTTLAAAVIMVAFTADGAESDRTAQQIEEMIGVRLSELPPKFGAPKDVSSSRSTRPPAERYRVNDDCVQFGYGSYGFLVNFETIQGCVFLSGWDSPVHGVKLGEAVEGAVQTLGKQYEQGKKPVDPAQFYKWRLPGGDRTMLVYYDENKTIVRIEVWNLIEKPAPTKK